MSQANLAESIKRLLPSESDKRIRQAILLAAGFASSAGRAAVRNLERSLEQPTAVLNTGTLVFNSIEEATLADWAWKIDFVIVQSGSQTIPVDEPDEDFPRVDYFHGSIEDIAGELTGVIHYTPGDLDSAGNAIFPNIPEEHIILARVVRNPDGSNGTPETPSQQFQDAPFDGNIYARQNQTWVSIPEGGGRDQDAVHYDEDDEKNATEKQRARNNIGSDSGIAQIHVIPSTTVQGNSFFKTSNLIYFQLGANSQLRGINDEDGLIEGESLTVVNDSPLIFSVINEYHPIGSGFEHTNFSVGSDFRIEPNQSRSFRYIKNRWRPSLDGLNRQGSDTSSVESYRFFNPTTGEERMRYSGGSGSFGTPRDVLFIYSETQGYPVFIVRQGTPGAGLKTNLGQVTIRSASGNSTRNLLSILNSDGVSVYGITADGHSEYFNHAPRQPRTSGGARARQSIRRDEQRLLYRLNVTTSGVINDLVLEEGTFNYRFTNATQITGFGNGEIGMVITIQNDNANDLTIPHQNTGSIAANRYNGIGSVDLIIPSKGKADLIYCDNSRWELLTKNY